MSLRISAPVSPSSSAASSVEHADHADPTKEAKAPKKARHTREAAEASREFEAIFVRTILKSTSLGGKGDAYSDMGIDAIAKSVTSGKGLGLSDVIRQALEREDARR